MHPDLHDYLWDKAGSFLSPDCCWVIRAIAALAHPETKIVFAMTGGTHGIRIRLAHEHAEKFNVLASQVLTPSERFTWVHSRLNVEEDQAMLKIAFHDAATRDDTEPIRA